MRDNSGGGKSQNNAGNPSLKESERAHGHSGEAITGEQKAKGSNKQRTESRTDANVK